MLPDERPAPIYLLRPPAAAAAAARGPCRRRSEGALAGGRAAVGEEKRGRPSQPRQSAGSGEGYSIGSVGSSGKREETGDKRHEKRSVPGKSERLVSLCPPFLRHRPFPSRCEAGGNSFSFIGLPGVGGRVGGSQQKRVS